MARFGSLRSLCLYAGLAICASAAITSTSTASTTADFDDRVVITIETFHTIDNAALAAFIEPETVRVEKLRTEAEAVPPLKLPVAVDRMVREANSRVALDTYRRQRGIG